MVLVMLNLGFCYQRVRYKFGVPIVGLMCVIFKEMPREHSSDSV
jgi:hypothetical protein